MIKRALIFILTTFSIIIITGSSAFTQKAPEFSNDLMMGNVEKLHADIYKTHRVYKKPL